MAAPLRAARYRSSWSDRRRLDAHNPPTDPTSRNVKMKSPSKPAFAMLGMLFFSTTACGGGVEGSTYAGNGGMVKIEFQSNGTAYVATGPISTACTYSESGDNVTLVCEGGTTVLAVGDDGALSGPPDGLMGRLIKEQK
jgi:hypothetical protein